MVLVTSCNGEAIVIILYIALIVFEEFSYVENSGTKSLEFKL